MSDFVFTPENKVCLPGSLDWKIDKFREQIFVP